MLSEKRRAKSVKKWCHHLFHKSPRMMSTFGKSSKIFLQLRRLVEYGLNIFDLWCIQLLTNKVQILPTLTLVERATTSCRKWQLFCWTVTCCTMVEGLKIYQMDLNGLKVNFRETLNGPKVNWSNCNWQYFRQFRPLGNWNRLENCNINFWV